MAYTGYVFEIGLYGGNSKPVNVHEFLSEFVHELQVCGNEGIVLGNGIMYSVAVHSFVCDAPARAYIKCLKSHNSYNGCEQCMQVGKWTSGRMTYPSPGKPRCGEAFASRKMKNIMSVNHL